MAEGQILFQRWSKNPASIAVSLQEPVLNLAARHASAETWKHISGMANTALGSNEKARYHTALSLVKDPKLAQRGGVRQVSRILGRHLAIFVTN